MINPRSFRCFLCGAPTFGLLDGNLISTTFHTHFNQLDLKTFHLPLLAIFLLAETSLTAQVTNNLQLPTSVNGSGGAPHASAMLDVQSDSKGVLVPRMTTAQRTMIASPATGLLVFDTTTGGFWFFNGTAWVNLSASNALADADGDTKIQVEESPDEDIIRFDLGGTESMVLRKNAFGAPRLELPNALYNTFVGENAGSANTTGYYNTASGSHALFSNTTGTSNTAIGNLALYSNTTGIYNTATGDNALRFNTTGNQNTAIGSGAMGESTSGSNNTACGTQALRYNTTGIANSATGFRALQFNTTGYYNTANGTDALWQNTTGNSNTAYGTSALSDNTTGSINTAIGGGTLSHNKANSRSTAIGYSAMRYADDRTTGRDTYNTAIGYEALKGGFPAADNTGQWNTGGPGALFQHHWLRQQRQWWVCALFHHHRLR